MKIKNIAFLGIVILSSQFSTGAQDQLAIPEKPALVLVAKPTKLIYAKGEQVEFNFTLRNVSSNALIVARRLQLTLNVELKISDAQDKPVEWCGRIADQLVPLQSRYVSLSPGESVRAKLVVSCENKDDRTRAWGYILHAPGKYVVKATYRLPQPKEYFEKLFPNTHVVRGPILADPVTIDLRQ